MEQQAEKEKAETYNSLYEGYAHMAESMNRFWSHITSHDSCDTTDEMLDSIQSMQVYLQSLIKKANINKNTLKLMREEIFKEIEQNEGVID